MPFLKALRRRLPRMSPTEAAALEAGTVWVEGEFFSGRPDFRRMLAEAYPKLTERERAFLEGPVVEVCRLVDPWRVRREKRLPEEVWEVLRRERFFGLLIPEEHGGHGFSNLCASAVFGKLTSRSMYLGTLVLIPNSVGPGELLLEYGTEEQQRHYLPRLARGEEIPCFALTEPEAGSDAAALASRGEVFRGEDGELKLRLNWDKRYITLAPVATLVGLAFRLSDPEELLGMGPEPGITCALVPADAEGVEIGDHHDPMALAFPNGPIRGRDVVVPLSAIIGGAAGAGKGWRMLMEALSGGRAISLPAQSTAGAKWTARVAGAYAAVRRQFGLSIGRFEGVQEPLARIAGHAYLMEAARVYTCGAVDSGQRPAVVSAVMKYNLTELGRRTVIDGMDVLAGAGICHGPHNLLADGYIASSIGITVEGANILTRTLITFGQGSLRCHPYLRRELEAVQSGDGGKLAKALAGHGFFFLRNLLRTGALSLSRGLLAPAPVSGPTARYYRHLAWASARFALYTDLAVLSLGGSLKRRGKLTGRYADALSWMLLGFAALRRYEAEGRQEEDLPLVQWCAETALERIQEAFEGIATGLDAPLLKWWMRGPARFWLRLNPLGRGPSDDLGRRAAAVLAPNMKSGGKARDRLTSGLHLEGVGIERLERAFELLLEVEPLERRLREAVANGQLPRARGEELLESAVAEGILTTEEAAQLRHAEAARREACAVDTFSPEEYFGEGTMRKSPGEGRDRTREA
ncbi:MAG: acyl-CoA dehydrogenase [Acidobacteriota bacterium]|nr:acyl-CoA dehydrogenase [Acidobacteriota bacterium]